LGFSTETERYRSEQMALDETQQPNLEGLAMGSYFEPSTELLDRQLQKKSWQAEAEEEPLALATAEILKSSETSPQNEPGQEDYDYAVESYPEPITRFFSRVESYIEPPTTLLTIHEVRWQAEAAEEPLAYSTAAMLNLQQTSGQAEAAEEPITNPSQPTEILKLWDTGSKKQPRFAQARQNEPKLEEWPQIDNLDIPTLLAALYEPVGTPYTRQEAAETLGRAGRVVILPLLAALKSKDAEVRYHAILALSYIGDKQAVEPLIDALQDKEWTVQCRAALALARMGDDRAFEPIMALFRHAPASLRFGLAIALGDLGDKRALPFLKEIAQRDTEALTANGSVSKAAKKAIERIQKQN
jgi:hypothetical protein